MIRPARPSDSESIVAIARDSGLFEPHELEDVEGMLSAFLQGELPPLHQWVLLEDEGPVAIAYYAPETLSDSVWNLYLLAVSSGRHGQGHGEKLVRYVENEAKANGGRMLLIETSGLSGFERTRRFYEHCGYAEEARVRDYYAPGDDKVIFRKVICE